MVALVRFAGGGNSAEEPVTDPALFAENLSLAYDETELFSGVEIRLNPGEWLLLRGANGSGKTSLLKLLAGLIRRPRDARIDWAGVPLAEAAAEGGLIGWLGHSPGLIEPLSALENIQLDPGLDLHSAMDALRGAGLDEVADLPV
ncbi:MAG: ATP-binding cassette domain-containing protein, partial [Gammaproteobacteria bacterium AqS3]|nr:ATP-binding cassette domain-containing protein [Gammaproteobacteria bacterium AqS3]